MFQMRPYKENESCSECQELAREINEALASSFRENRSAARALYALIGGEERDAQLAEQMLVPFTYQPAAVTTGLPPRLGDVSRRTHQHTKLTGHKLQKARL
jgi:hypothetical protein